MAIIPPDFDLSRTPSVDKWGYSANKKMSGFIANDSILKFFLRNMRLSYAIRDIRYKLLNLNRISDELFSETKLPESYKYIKEFKKISVQHDLPYAIVLLPTLGGGFPISIQEKLRQDRINTIDISSLSQKINREQFMASRFDGHPSTEVHRRIAKELSNVLLQKYFKADKN